MQIVARCRRSFWWSLPLLFFVILCFTQAPGFMVADTKLDLVINPGGFLKRALNLWDPISTLGQVQNQAYGYLFPQGAFFWVGHLLGVTGWVLQRVWWVLILELGFVGFVLVIRRLGFGQGFSGVVGGLAFVLSARSLLTLTSISSETWCFVLSVWILLPVVVVFNGGVEAQRIRVLAGYSAVGVAFCGGINGFATVAACLPALCWVICSFRHRFWLRFVKWWVPLCLIVSLWWLVPLFILGKVSPSFLDFIESSRATLRWDSLVETLRGTATWSSFVSSDRSAGLVLVSDWAVVLVSGLVVVFGLGGLVLWGRSNHSVQSKVRPVVWMLLVGVLIYALGYGIDGGWVNGLGSPLFNVVRSFLDGVGAPFRNVQKCEPLLRIPLCLGLVWFIDFGFEQVADVANAAFRRGILVFALVCLSVLPLFSGVGVSGRVSWGLTPSPAFAGIPSYWVQAADWLKKFSVGRTLVVPGAPFADQRWGYTRDFPLQPLAKTPWAVRDAIPLVPPQGIRFLDSIESAIDSGYMMPGLAQTLVGAGFDKVLVATDADPRTARSSNPLLALQTLGSSPGFKLATTFGMKSSIASVKGFVNDSGLEPPLYPIYIFNILGSGSTGLASIVDSNQVRRVNGGAESLLRINNADQVFFNTNNGLIASLVNKSGVGVTDSRPRIITDTPFDRETNYGEVVDNHSFVKTKYDPRRVQNKVPDYPANSPRIYGSYTVGDLPVKVSVSSSASDATQLGNVLTALNPSAMFDNDSQTSWASRNLQTAVGQWVEFKFDKPVNNLGFNITLGKPIGSSVDEVAVETDNSTTYTNGLKPGIPTTLNVPNGLTKTFKIIASGTENGSNGNQFTINDLQLINLSTGELVPIRFHVKLPELNPKVKVSDWILGQQQIGRDSCVNNICGESLGLSATEPRLFTRTLSVPTPMNVNINLSLRSITGAGLNKLITNPININAPNTFGDLRGAVNAMIDSNPQTAWTDVVDPNTHRAGQITINLPEPKTINGITITQPENQEPAPATSYLINTGNGSTVIHLPPNGTHYIPLPPNTTNEITLTPLTWVKKIDVNSLGITSNVAPGIAELMLNTPEGPAWKPVNPNQIITTSCLTNPIKVAISGRILNYNLTATRAELLNHDEIKATPCEPYQTIKLPDKEQEIVINPTNSFTVSKVDIHNTAYLPPSPIPAATITNWKNAPDEASGTITSNPKQQILFIHQSVNPGWQAKIGSTILKSITINGWQQGFIIPPNTPGQFIMKYTFDGIYRLALFGGLILMFLTMFLSTRSKEFYRKILRRKPKSETIQTPDAHVFKGLSRPLTLIITILTGYLISGVIGAVIALAMIFLNLTARFKNNPRLWATLTMLSYGAAIILLSRNPWESPWGYAGFSTLIQGLSLIPILIITLYTLGKEEGPPSDKN